MEEHQCQAHSGLQQALTDIKQDVTDIKADTKALLEFKATIQTIINEQKQFKKSITYPIVICILGTVLSLIIGFIN